MSHDGGEGIGRGADDVSTLDFSSLVALLREPNMPSGGAETVRRVLRRCPLDGDATVLEIGCNTGFTTIEIASWTRAHVVGIDVNDRSLTHARAKATRYGIDNASFVRSDALALPFGAGTFDLVFCSNVTSFIVDHAAAAAEYRRVLRPRGVLAAVPIYYVEDPPEPLRRAVGAAIGIDLPVLSRDYWIELFSDPRLHLFAEEAYRYDDRSADDIRRYVDMVMQQADLDRERADVRRALHDRLLYFYELFNENLRYAGFSILLWRLDHPNREPILHSARRVHT